MTLGKFNCGQMQGKTIDLHSHLGIHCEMYRELAYPCCQSVEGLYYRQLSSGIDVNVVFPYGSYPGRQIPYELDNRRLVREIYEYCPELSDRFIPFICLDPGRQVQAQLAEARQLSSEYPIYGIKINPVDCRVPVQLLGERPGNRILDFAADYDLPLLFHAVPRGVDQYSAAEDILAIAESRQRLRFCLAHCLLFCRDLLDWANGLGNTWVDTAAFHIQLKLVKQLVTRKIIDPGRLIKVDFNDHRAVMQKLVDDYPNLMIWGSDAPAYTYFYRRQQGAGKYHDFRLKGRYEDEVAALRGLPGADIYRVANQNPLNFLKLAEEPEKI